MFISQADVPVPDDQMDGLLVPERQYSIHDEARLSETPERYDINIRDQDNPQRQEMPLPLGLFE